MTKPRRTKLDLDDLADIEVQLAQIRDRLNAVETRLDGAAQRPGEAPRRETRGTGERLDWVEDKVKELWGSQYKGGRIDEIESRINALEAKERL